MHLRWDWLAPVAAIPYVPALGPVAPAAFSAGIFRAVADASRDGRFLPYDKDRRWSATKNEHVLTADIIHQPGLTIIPTLATWPRPAIKIHIYSAARPDLCEVAAYSQRLNSASVTARRVMIWFQTEPRGAATRLMLKTFTPYEPPPGRPVTTLADSPHADTFAAFTAAMSNEGFAFLHQRITAGHDDGPILVTTTGNRIVGALGPLSTITDPLGGRQQPPQYFAVLPEYRSQGHGRALWRASMTWGTANDASYKLVQAATGSPAEKLYLSEGLTTLDFTYTAPPPTPATTTHDPRLIPPPTPQPHGPRPTTTH